MLEGEIYCKEGNEYIYKKINFPKSFLTPNSSPKQGSRTPNSASGYQQPNENGNILAILILDSRNFDKIWKNRWK